MNGFARGSMIVPKELLMSCVMSLAIPLAMPALVGCADLPRAQPATPKSAAGLRLYVMDCGTIGPMDPTSFGLTADEIGAIGA